MTGTYAAAIVLMKTIAMNMQKRIMMSGWGVKKGDEDKLRTPGDAIDSSNKLQGVLFILV